MMRRNRCLECSETFYSMEQLTDLRCDQCKPEETQKVLEEKNVGQKASIKKKGVTRAVKPKDN